MDKLQENTHVVCHMLHLYTLKIETYPIIFILTLTQHLAYCLKFNRTVKSVEETELLILLTKAMPEKDLLNEIYK